MTASLERLQMLRDGRAPAPPIAGLLGFSLSDVDDGHAVIDFVAGERHANPMGTLHGGVFCDLADGAMGMAYATLLGEGETFTTLELKINFLRPVWNATLTAEGRVVQSGRSVGLIECDVTDERGRHVARASSTCMKLRGEQANGRQAA